jgi:enoyl-CoA hydratase
VGDLLLMSQPILTETRDRSLIIRFNRPEIRSPLSIEVLELLTTIFDGISVDTDRVIFTGVGNVFASGADLREIATVTADSAREFALRGQSLMAKIDELSQITIAAVNGYCFGGALDLALACDKRIASAEAQFAHPGADLGIMTGWGGTQRLPRLVGEAIALEMFFTAKRVGADEAMRIGLVDAVVPDPLEYALEFSST